MECPHCHNRIEGRSCPACGAEVPAEGFYCMYCGAPLEEADFDGSEENGTDLDDRVLCPDGTCTGIIIDGKCSECGRPYGDADKTEPG
ncbi:MAG: zinc ribbon domain-containing protein [Deltaproteobacteria bacterium]|nr:zinc ribbon domain-containing protein [Deltaproteobacteria bacterium]